MPEGDPSPKSVQDFLANGFTISIVRNMGPGGTLKCIQEFIKEIDLAAISKKDASQYPQILDDLTEKLVKAMPGGAGKWGVARKCLNLFFRDALYNFYLWTEYNLDKFQKYMEIPLDSYVGKALQHIEATPHAPRWRSVKGVTKEYNAKFQAVAETIAEQRGTKRVHLDVVYWRGNVQSSS